MLPLHASDSGMVPLEIREPGEYRTRRLVLEALDRMKANCEFKAMGM
jgi:hypothetical protein